MIPTLSHTASISVKRGAGPSSLFPVTVKVSFQENPGAERYQAIFVL